MGRACSKYEREDESTDFWGGGSQKGKIPLRTFRIHKMLGYSPVAARRKISQERLGSTNLSGGFNMEIK
jgi:hypothetical protein